MIKLPRLIYFGHRGCMCVLCVCFREYGRIKLLQNSSWVRLTEMIEATEQECEPEDETTLLPLDSVRTFSF